MTAVLPPAGICTVISVATALMLLWLIPGLFRLAKALEKDRVEKVMLDSLGGALKVRGP